MCIVLSVSTILLLLRLCVSLSMFCVLHAIMYMPLCVGHILVPSLNLTLAILKCCMSSRTRFLHMQSIIYFNTFPVQGHLILMKAQNGHNQLVDFSPSCLVWISL